MPQNLVSKLFPMRTPTSILALFLLLGCVAVSNIHAAVAGGNRVTYTRLTDDVKGFEKLGIVHGKAKKTFGEQDQLADAAIANAADEAAKLGATIILITRDEFSFSPLNNVSIEAVAYRPANAAQAEEKKTVQAAPTSAATVEATRLIDDVKGMEKLGVVRGKAKKAYGSQDTLREKALGEAKTEAAKLGATTIFITLDRFAPTPLNNVFVEAVAFRSVNLSSAAAPTTESTAEKQSIPPTSPEKIDFTRLPDDVKGKTKLGIVHGKAQKAFGDQDMLREKAIAEAKVEAAKLGATIMLITLDNFEQTPLNNVAIEAVAYK